jgi:hypothetical protein
MGGSQLTTNESETIDTVLPHVNCDNSPRNSALQMSDGLRAE